MKKLISLSLALCAFGLIHGPSHAQTQIGCGPGHHWDMQCVAVKNLIHNTIMAAIAQDPIWTDALAEAEQAMQACKSACDDGDLDCFIECEHVQDSAVAAANAAHQHLYDVEAERFARDMNTCCVKNMFEASPVPVDANAADIAWAWDAHTKHGFMESIGLL